MKRSSPISLAVLLMVALVMAIPSIVQASSFTLSGNVLDVGVGSGGTLVNDTNTQGITFRPSNFANDFTQPGLPWEFYSIGINGAFVTAMGAAGLGSPPITTLQQNPLGLTTANTSSGTTLQAVSFDGIQSLGGGHFNYDQTLSFDTNSNTISFKADIFNTGTTTLTNVVYARGMDPDQDVKAFNDFRTVNTFPAADQVRAVGLNTGLQVTITDLTPDKTGVASISGPAGGPWAFDPYTLVAGGFVNNAAAGNVDDSINMAWDIGDILPGRSVEIEWSYKFEAVPVQPSALLLGTGLLGLLGFGIRRKQS